MFRFIALKWDKEDQQAGAIADEVVRRLVHECPDWLVSFESPGTKVLHVDATAGASEQHLLHNNAGIVLGTLFDRSADARNVRALGQLTATQSESIQRSAGRRLVDEYWGRYVAFVTGNGSSDLRVIRDPVGSLPFYSTVVRRLRIFFSRADDIAPLQILNLNVNWKFVAAHVYRPRFLRCSETAFEEVEELLPGECWTCTRDQKVDKQHYWTPVTFDRQSQLGIVPRLRATTELCVSAWASCYPRAIHLLSGGIDSSIVLDCLYRTRPDTKVTAVNYFNSFSSYADERLFARLAAQSSRCQLMEIEEDPGNADLRVLMSAPPSVRPLDMQYYQTHSALEQRAAELTDANAIFTGNGGDHLFFQGPLTLAAADYVREKGLDRYWLTLCNKIARYEGLAFWTVLATSLADGWRLRKWNPNLFIRKIRLATPGVARLANASGLLNPPWLKNAPTGIPIGKLEHMRVSAVPNDFYNPLAPRHSPERISPLISQPLIELCLGIPLYLQAWNAQDRLVAREAFRHFIPAEIIQRRGKGTADSFMQKLLARNMTFARELLLDGILVSRDYLDRRKLEEALSHVEGPLRPEAGEIVIFHLNTESWLQNARRNWPAVTS